MASWSETDDALPETPHQPETFSFPKRDFGKRERSFQGSWFRSWSWLHYSEASDSVYAITVKPGATEAAFVS